MLMNSIHRPFFKQEAQASTPSRYTLRSHPTIVTRSRRRNVDPNPQSREASTVDFNIVQCHVARTLQVAEDLQCHCGDWQSFAEIFNCHEDQTGGARGRRYACMHDFLILQITFEEGECGESFNDGQWNGCHAAASENHGQAPTRPDSADGRHLWPCQSGE